jgi:CheY-like chemotaxis protein
MMMTKDPVMMNWVVLLVDDEPDNIGVAQKVLTFHGATVHTATNGVEALAVLDQMPRPTFILSDLSMPQMDGWMLLRRIRAHESYSQLPVIALTAHAMLGDREAVLAAGFNHYIAKPFSIHTFLVELKACLRDVGVLH